MIQDTMRKVAGGESLTREEAQEVMTGIMEGKATPVQIAAILIALRMKGETVDEITGFAEIMAQKAARIRVTASPLVDTCGTGGDGAGTFNISTTTAFVVAGAGVAVAKHGNRAVSSKCGSADMLEALGARIDLTPREVETCINEVGIGFLFAQAFHGATHAVAAVRKELGVRTVFNVLGPLTNPASVTHQIVGVYDARLTETIARVLRNRGVQRALVVHGDGLDEVTTCGKTKIAELVSGGINKYEIGPEDFGISPAALDDIRGGSPAENAATTTSILRGERGPRRDIVVLNSAAALYVAGKASTIMEGIDLACRSIDTGLAARKLDLLIRATNSMKKGGQQ
jgi:anthranilate phosphoribosyltransferase